MKGRLWVSSDFLIIDYSVMSGKDVTVSADVFETSDSKVIILPSVFLVEFDNSSFNEFNRNPFSFGIGSDVVRHLFLLFSKVHNYGHNR